MTTSESERLAFNTNGGGWVSDSEPEAEFQETVNQSKAMLNAVALAEMFPQWVGSLRHRATQRGNLASMQSRAGKVSAFLNNFTCGPPEAC